MSKNITGAYKVLQNIYLTLFRHGTSIRIIIKIQSRIWWTEECSIDFNSLKKKLVESPILRFLNWSVKFHVHINTSGIEIDVILTQPRDERMDYPIVYSSRKLNKVEWNYSTTEREALGMVFAL